MKIKYPNILSHFQQKHSIIGVNTHIGVHYGL